MKLILPSIILVIILNPVVNANDDQDDTDFIEASRLEAKNFGTYEPTFEPGYRPEISSDAGGFWYKVDKIEERLKHSPVVIRDPILNNYVEELTCKVAGIYCPHIRVYIIDSPHFNASMFPNGMMHIWSGLLLRVQNEAQLSAVLAHEIAHFLLSHQITQWRKLRNGAAVATFMDAFLTAGFATLAVAGNTMSFSRLQEAQADFYGLELMEKAGYSPHEAHVLWQQIINESNNDDSKAKRSDFFASHPKNEQRVNELLDLSKKHFSEKKDYQLNKAQYIDVIAPHYLAFMDEQIKLQDFGRTEFLLKSHRSLGLPKSIIDYFRAKMHALRKNDGDLEQAIILYKNSIIEKDTPPQAYRDLGFLLTKKKDPIATEYLQTYLRINPEAPDKTIVNFYIKMLN